MRIIILFTILLSTVFTQISQGGLPTFYNRDLDVEFIEPNRDNLVDRDFHPMVFQFGEEYNLDIDFIEQSRLSVENDIHTYILGIKSLDAFGIGVIFDDFYLSENSSLFLYDLDQTMFIGSFNSNNNKESLVFPTSVVKGDHIIIELNVPRSELDIVKLNIGTIIHDYEDIMGYFTEYSESNREDCNTNVVCPEGERVMKIKLMRRFEFQWEEVCVQLPL